VHLLWGDLGSKCAFSLGPGCTCGMVSSCGLANTSAGAISEVALGFDRVVALHYRPSASYQSYEEIR
jgi:hypothetical protein